MTYVLIILAILGPLAGVLLGVYLAGRSPSPVRGSLEHTRAITLMREADMLRRLVLDFVARARSERPPTQDDWHELVGAMLHPGTPESICELHHKKCGTHVSQDRTIVRCHHGHEWYEPPPEGVSIGCSLCDTEAIQPATSEDGK